jgi:phosphoglycolate phosphatase
MRAVIFDFDGTIADSFTAVIDIAYKLTKNEQLADINHIHGLRSKHNGLREAIRLLDLPQWRGAWLLKKGRKMMAQDINGIPMFAGMDQAISRLRNAKFELFIVTSNSTNNVERFLSSQGMLDDFKAVYGGAGMFSKQRLIKKAMKINRLSPNTAIYVGDEVRDIEAARELKMPVVAVTWGYNTEQLLLQHQPNVVAREPKQLADVIIDWGSGGY